MSEASFGQGENAGMDAGSDEPGGFTSVADRLAANIASSATHASAAGQDMVSLIQTLLDAGKELAKSLAMQRELGSVALRAVEDARAAAAAAAGAAAESKESEAASRGFLERTEKEYGTVSWLVQNLQQRIAALSALASPMPGASLPDTDAEEDDDADLRAAS